MNTINIHIDETIDHHEIGALYEELMTTQYVRNVEVRAAQPHDMLVEFDEHHNMPMHLLEMLQSKGLHADIVGC